MSDEFPTVDPETGMVEGYIAEYGDWVRLADGRAATVVKANAAYDNRGDRPGAYYALMFKDGDEKTFYHWEGDDFLTENRFTGKIVTQPLFTVVSQEA